MADIGRWAIALTLLVSAYTALASILGARRRNAALIESARNGAFVTAASATIASAMLISLLLNRDYGIRYVYQHVDRYLPVLYTLSAFWAGQEGSLLLWLWFVTLLTAAVVLQRRTWGVGAGPCTHPYCTHPYVLAAMALAQGFLALVLLLPCNPFARLPMAPVDGLGLNPLLQNPWMVIHPPVVFMGYAAYTVPFALALGGLVTGQRRVTDSLGQDWLPAVRRWALLAWLFLGAGIWMGAWWAYVELGWGGYWGWDPVENASLIPWLTGTALLHSLRMQRRVPSLPPDPSLPLRAERVPTAQGFDSGQASGGDRGGAWSLWLIALTFVLCVLATTITRSGLIESVHAFGRSPVGYSFIAWIALCMLAFVVLLSMRRREVDASASDWVNPGHPTRLLSRKASLLLTNLLLCGTALVVLVGTLFPALSEALRGRPIALGTSFYERTVGPLLQAVILLMGICPWLAWRGSIPARLRRHLWLPAAGALVTAILFLVLGSGQASAWQRFSGASRTRPALSFSLIAFVALSILAVFYRDVVARRRRVLDLAIQHEQGWPQQLAHLVRRNRRHYGAHVVHLGIVLIAIGVAGSSIYGQEVQVVLAPGERAEVSGYTLAYQDLLSEETPTRQQFTAVVRVQRGRSTAVTLRPRKDFYWNVEQWVTEVAIRSTLREDLYLILAGFEEDGLASFYVWINPLVAWLWIGGAALLLGGAVAWWPSASLRGKSANDGNRQISK